MGQLCTRASTAKVKSHFELIREADACVDRGNASQESLETAVGLLTIAVDEQPTYAMSYYGRGKLLLKLRLYKAAIADFYKAIELSRCLWAAHFMLAEALEALGEDETAAGVLAKIPRDVRDLRAVDRELEAEVDEKKVAAKREHEAKYAAAEEKFEKNMQRDRNVRDMKAGKRRLFVHDAVAIRRAERSSEFKHQLFMRQWEAEVGPRRKGGYDSL
jgi:tetratricopeptide (TPR) repeat protein